MEESTLSEWNPLSWINRHWCDPPLRGLIHNGNIRRAWGCLFHLVAFCFCCRPVVGCNRTIISSCCFNYHVVRHMNRVSHLITRDFLFCWSGLKQGLKTRNQMVIWWQRKCDNNLNMKKGLKTWWNDGSAQFIVVEFY